MILDNAKYSRETFIYQMNVIMNKKYQEYNNFLWRVNMDMG